MNTQPWRRVWQDESGYWFFHPYTPELGHQEVGIHWMWSPEASNKPYFSGALHPHPPGSKLWRRGVVVCSTPEESLRMWEQLCRDPESFIVRTML